MGETEAQSLLVASGNSESKYIGPKLRQFDSVDQVHYHILLILQLERMRVREITRNGQCAEGVPLSSLHLLLVNQVSVGCPASGLLIVTLRFHLQSQT